MIQPTRYTLYFLAALLSVSIVAIWVGPLLYGVWAGLGLYTILSVVDVAFIALQSLREVERLLPSQLALGVHTDVGLRLRTKRRSRHWIEVFDHSPTSFRQFEHPLWVVIPAGQHALLSYKVQPTERGVHTFSKLECWFSSPIKLWRRRQIVEVATEVRVYPNFKAVARYALLATSGRLGRLGIKQVRRRGEGLEFRELRDYRVGDPLRRIDWKATSRRRRTICREFQEERDQQLFFLLDCGRRMRSHDGDLSHFDRSLNAMLLLCYVALKQGDRVGFGTFGTAQGRWLAPHAGMVQLNRVLEKTFDLYPSFEQQDIGDALAEVEKRLEKRSLVVVLSNRRDEQSAIAEQMIRRLKRRHLLVAALLREEVINDILQRPIKSIEDIYKVAATHRYLELREKGIQQWQNAGLDCLDTTPTLLPSVLVNHYLRVKARGEL